LAIITIASVTLDATATAVVSAREVDTSNRVRAAVIEAKLTFVDFGTVEAIALIARIALASVAADITGAISVDIALFLIDRDVGSAGIDWGATVRTQTVAGVPRATVAIVASIRVDTGGNRWHTPAIVDSTLVDVDTAIGSHTVTVLSETTLTCTIKRPRCIGTICIRRAAAVVEGAFVNVLVAVRALPSRVAATSKRLIDAATRVCQITLATAIRGRYVGAMGKTAGNTAANLVI
jgi:hypothetical protein